jgi:hypothetical protein
MAKDRTGARYEFSGLIVESERPLEELRPDESAAPVEVSIVWTPTGSTPAPLRWYQTWRTDTGDAYLRLGDLPDGYLLEFPDIARFTLTRQASVIGIEPAPGMDEPTIRHFLLNQVLPLACSRRGRLVIHASAASTDGHVVAFMGRAGSGKSTLAAAAEACGARIVSDDSLALQKTDAGWLAAPSYPAVRFWPDTLDLLGWRRSDGAAIRHQTDKLRFVTGLTFETRTLPLARLYVLSPETGAGIAPLRGSGAATALAGQLFRLDIRDRDESRRLFDLVVDLASTIPMFRLGTRGGTSRPVDLARRVLDPAPAP